MRIRRFYLSSITTLSLGIGAISSPLAAVAAEKITFNLSPFGDFNVQIKDLETLVDSGTITPELAYYTNRLPPQQVGKLPDLLSTPLELNPLAVYKFSQSAVGEAVIKNFGKAVRSDVQRNGFYALRSAVIAAAFSPEGLTAINILRQFPHQTIYVDLQSLDLYITKIEQLFRDRQSIVQAFMQSDDLNQNDNSEANEIEKLKNLGNFSWNKQTFAYHNPGRHTKGYFDLYLPKSSTPVPVIIISHGLASNRQTFAYLGKHYASHGFAVAVIEHSDISMENLGKFLSGEVKFPEPTNLVDQPLDVKYVIDKLEQESQSNPQLQDKLNLEQIGALGQSFGGYTVLALAGGQLDPTATRAICQENNYDRLLLDLSSLAKCTFKYLPPRPYQLQDQRIKAVMAINPLGKIFAEEGMSQIKIPTAIVSGTNDLITPPVTEQMLPFTWLKSSDKYLFLVQPGTHFSFLQEGTGVFPVPDTLVGPSANLAHPALKAASTAFFKTHVAQESEYQSLLTRDRVSAIESEPFRLSLIRSLTQTQLEQAIDRELSAN